MAEPELAKKCLYELEEKADDNISTVDISAHPVGKLEVQEIISKTYLKSGNQIMARYYAENASTYALETFGVNSDEYLQSCNNLLDVLLFSHHIELALEKIDSIMPLFENVYGKNTKQYHLLLHKRGLAYLEMDDFSNAEKDLLQVYKYNSDYSVISNLGDLYRQLGNISKAEKLFLKALAKDDLSNEVRAHLLSKLAGINKDKKNYSKANALYSESIELLGSHIGYDHIDVAIMKANLAMVLFEQGEEEKGWSLCDSILYVFQNHSDLYYYALMCGYISTYLCREKQYDKCKEYLDLAIRCFEDSLSNNLSIMSNFYGGRGVLGCYTNEDVQEIRSYMQKADSLYRLYYLQTLDFMSASERAMFWKEFLTFYDHCVPTYVSYSRDAEFAYNTSLFRTGILLASSQEVVSSILSSNDEHLMELWADLTNIQIKIDREDFAAFDISTLNMLKDSALVIEKEVTRLSSQFRSLPLFMSVTWEGIKEYLSSGEVSIEYMINILLL